MHTELVTDALKNAAKTTLIEPNAIWRSARGSVSGCIPIHRERWSGSHPDPSAGDGYAKIVNSASGQLFGDIGGS